MIDPNHPNPEKQLQLPVELPRQKAQTNAERQRAWRDRQKALGRYNRTFSVTETEAYFLERVLLSMRENPGSYPTAMRNAKGQMQHLDT
jgi:hypothetical protein